MFAGPSFKQLNEDWNAEPNVPEPEVRRHGGTDILLHFYVNPYQFKQFKQADRGILRFSRCSRFRLGSPNDEGWHRGQCRYGKLAPRWGEFYELIGDDPVLDLAADWQTIDPGLQPASHFLFYLRDNTFECMADAWQFEPDPVNALYRNFLTRS